MHTPCSCLNNQFGSDWDQYVRTLFDLAIEKNVGGVAITDYFCIDGFKRLKQDYLDNDEKLLAVCDQNPQKVKKIKEMLFIPSVELRLDTFVGAKRSINLHVLFSETVPIDHIEDYFLHEIEFIFSGKGKGQKLKLKPGNLESLGQKLKKEQPQFSRYSDLVVGMMNAVVDPKEVKEILERDGTRFEGKYLIGLPPDEDLSDIDWNSLDHNTRKVLIQMSDFLFASNPKTISWAAGEKSRSVEDFKQEFGSLKPCLWGCDAHRLEDIFEVGENRYTWIKSDLTFEGLRQVKFEPTTRVYIGPNRPDEKLETQLINRVRFIDPKGRFIPDWIEFNPNLTAIIGGKSSGKSLLLYYIAKAIVPEELTRLQEKTASLNYSFESDQNFNVEVEWVDGEANSLQQPSFERLRKVTYIPHMYINRVVEEKSSTDLFRLLESILLENERYRAHHEDLLKRIKKNELELSSKISLQVKIASELDELEKKVKSYENQETLRKQISLTQKKLENLASASQLTPEQVTSYSSLGEKRENLKRRVEKGKVVLAQLEEFKRFIGDELANEITEIMSRHRSEIFYSTAENEILRDKLDGVIGSIGSDATALLTERLPDYFEFIGEYEDALEKLIKDLQVTEHDLAPLEAKVKNKGLLEKEQKALAELQKNITQIELLNARRKAAQDRLKQVTEEICRGFELFLQHHEKYLEEIKKDKIDAIAPDIQLLAITAVDARLFNEEVFNVLNLNSLKKAFPENYAEENQSLRRIDLQTIREIFKGIANNTIRVRSNMNREDILHRFAKNFFRAEFNLLNKGDELQKMSPGKMGLVILKMMLHLSNSKEPILIDQPEDNLDNRTIYNELNSYIKERKCKRQIIIVTHNANLVVSADAEEVIVANQDGQVSGKDNRQYKFEYTSGALENSFNAPAEQGTLFQKGIREHVCEILEGGEEAFLTRQNKYCFQQFM